MSAIVETYNDVKNMGRDLARRYSGSDVTYEDILSHFDEAFLEAYRGGWSPCRGSSFSTWVRTKAYFKVLDHRVKMRAENTVATDDLEWVMDRPSIEDDEDSVTIFQAFEIGDARRILDHLSANRELYEDLSTSYSGVKEARRRIRVYLRKTYDWHPKRIAAAMRQITTFLEASHDQLIQLDTSEIN